MINSQNRRQYIENTAKKITWGHWFVFFNSLWFILLGGRYAFLIDWPDTLLGKVYFFISLLGHFSFIVFAFYLLILFPLSFLLKNERTFRGVAVIFATVGLSLVLVDSEVFASFHLHLSSLVWNLLVNPENGELARRWQLFFAFMPLILLVQMLYSRWSWQKLRSLERQSWLKGVGLFYLLCFLAFHLMYAWADATLYRPITMQKSNFPLSYPMTARTFLEKHGFINKAKLNQQIIEEGRADSLKVDYPKAPLNFGASAHLPNIILFNLSGWRQDSLNAENMPFLSALLAQKGTEFSHHYSSGNTSKTGLFGLFYGLSADYSESMAQQKISPVLLQTLRAYHYDLQYYFKDRRQNHFMQKVMFKAKEQQRFHQLKTLPQCQTPCFLFIDESLPQHLSQKDYQNAITQFDEQLKTLFSHIDWQNTWVILTSTHGYTFKEQSEKARLNDFSRPLTQVPFIVFAPDFNHGKIHKLTSHLDFVPTLMQQLFKVKNPSRDYSQGQNLLPLQKEPNWVLTGNYRWNVIVTPNDTQYHLNAQGDFEQYNERYEKQPAKRPPLGLFLDVYNNESRFWAK